jgi:hypothetical protein
VIREQIYFRPQTKFINENDKRFSNISTERAPSDRSPALKLVFAGLPNNSFSQEDEDRMQCVCARE